MDVVLSDGYTWSHTPIQEMMNHKRSLPACVRTTYNRDFNFAVVGEVWQYSRLRLGPILTYSEALTVGQGCKNVAGVSGGQQHGMAFVLPYPWPRISPPLDATAARTHDRRRLKAQTSVEMWTHPVCTTQFF